MVRMGKHTTTVQAALMRIALAAVFAATLCSDASAVGFESLADGTLYGLNTNLPGEAVYTENGIRMSVENFVLGTSEFFFFAEIGGPGSQNFATNALSLDNISVRFDFADAGFAVNQVSFEYLDLGGASNLSVNDDTLFILNPLDSLPMNVAPGITATVESGLITLFGPIDSLLIGGQELVIDNVIAVPEPASGALLAITILTCWRRRRKTNERTA